MAPTEAPSPGAAAHDTPGSSASRPSGYEAVFRRRRWVVLLSVVVALLASAVVTARQTPVYRTSTSLIVTPSYRVEGTGDILRSLETLERRSVIATFARIPPTRAARLAAAERLGRPSSDFSGYRVDGSVVPSTNIINIDVEGPDGQLAAELANALATVTGDESRSLYRIFTVKVLVEAVPPSRPARPDPRRNAVVAAICGLLVGVAAVVSFARLSGVSPPGA